MDNATTKRLMCACIPCHRSKVSCDSARPCKRCKDRGFPADCVDHISKKRGRRSKAELYPATQFVPPEVRAEMFCSFFSCLQHHVEQHGKLPLFDNLLVLFSHLKRVLTLQQLEVIYEYIESVADETIDIETLKSAKPVVRTRLENLSPTDEQARVQRSTGMLLSKQALEFIPLPSFYSVVDLSTSTSYSHANQNIKDLLEIYPNEQIDMNGKPPYLRFFQMDRHDQRVFRNQLTMALLNFPNKHAFAAVMIGTKTGKTTPVTMQLSTEIVGPNLRTLMVGVWPQTPLCQSIVPSSPFALPAPHSSSSSSSSSSSFSSPSGYGSCGRIEEHDSDTSSDQNLCSPASYSPASTPPLVPYASDNVLQPFPNAMPHHSMSSSVTLPAWPAPCQYTPSVEVLFQPTSMIPSHSSQPAQIYDISQHHGADVSEPLAAPLPNVTDSTADTYTDAEGLPASKRSRTDSLFSSLFPSGSDLNHDQLDAFFATGSPLTTFDCDLL